MPSIFQTQFAPSRQILQGHFGELATYTAPDGTVTSGFYARFGAKSKTMVPKGTLLVEIKSCDILVDVVDLPNPVRGGRFNIEGEVWTLEHNPTTNNGGHVCTCSQRRSEKRGEQRESD